MKSVRAGLALAAGFAMTDLTVQDLWGRYVARGGSHTRYELACYLGGDGMWNAHEHDVAAHVINDYTSGHGMPDPVAYVEN